MKCLSKTEIETLTPLVHLNGDSKTTLMDNWSAFEDAIQKAIDLAPEVHGRNYYPKSDDQGQEAQWLRDKLRSLLIDVQSAACQVIVAIDNQ
jgi:hypothetical protein